MLGEDSRPEALPSVIACSSVQAIRAKNMELTKNLSDLLTTCGENHRSIVALLADISGGGPAESEPGGRQLLSGLRNEVNAASMHEVQLRGASSP